MLHAAARFALPVFLLAATAGAVSETPVPPELAAVRVPMSTLAPADTIKLGGSPDWMALTPDAVWIANDQLKCVQRIDLRTRQLVASISFPTAPSSGLAAGFGSIWVPLDGQTGGLARIDIRTGRVAARLPFPPGNDEGGIAVSPDSVWLVTDIRGTLLRIDPDKNIVRQAIALPPGSFNPLYADGIVWVTGFETNVLTAVEAHSGTILATIPVGPHPRFLTAAFGSIWTLNQGDGTITRVDQHTRRVVATIAAGLAGHGGDICAGSDAIWATLEGFPLTRINPATNRVVRQWAGPGGDEVRYGFGSLWLTHLRAGLLWRIPVSAAPPGTP